VTFVLAATNAESGLTLMAAAVKDSATPRATRSATLQTRLRRGLSKARTIVNLLASLSYLMSLPSWRST
jgi:hypothetical protein